jgi:hypothetical protein
VSNRKKGRLVALAFIFTGLFYILGTGRGMLVSWAPFYPNFNELYEDSDIIIRGIVGTSKTYNVKSGPGPRTTHQVEILETIKGETPSENIPVDQLGGYYMIWSVVEPPDYPLFHRGDAVILFLRLGGDGKYRSLGGPQGSYIVIEGKVHSVDERLGRVHPSGLNANGTEVNSFIHYLESFRDSP